MSQTSDPGAEQVAPDAAGTGADDRDGSTVHRGTEGSGGDQRDGGEEQTEPGADQETDAQAESERQKSAEEFAAEHDPAKHDVKASEEFRQPGDWVADQQEPQEWDSEGNLVSGGGPGAEAAGQSSGGGADAGSGTSEDSLARGATSATGSDRRVSELSEVRDGGYSVGSAAPIDDGAMPLGHPVKAWEDTKSYLTPDHPRYDDADPHVWFTDPGAAERAGFRRAD